VGNYRFPKPNPVCIECSRPVPLTPDTAITVKKDAKLIGYLHKFHCLETWQDRSPKAYQYGALPKK
jgi:hypothetical protein